MRKNEMRSALLGLKGGSLNLEETLITQSIKRKKISPHMKLKAEVEDDIIGGFYDNDELPESERIKKDLKRFNTISKLSQ